MSAGNFFVSLIKGILMFFGVLFIILIIGVVYFIWADPFDLRKYFTVFNTSQSTSATSSSTMDVKLKTQELTDNPLLTTEQETRLRAVGVDPASLPTQITPEMEACFLTAFGEVRMKEIVAGATPSAMELLKAKTCI